MDSVYIVRNYDSIIIKVFADKDEAVKFQKTEGPSWVTVEGHTVYDWYVDWFPVVT